MIGKDPAKMREVWEKGEEDLFFRGSNPTGTKPEKVRISEV